MRDTPDGAPVAVNALGGLVFEIVEAPPDPFGPEGLEAQLESARTRLLAPDYGRAVAPDEPVRAAPTGASARGRVSITI